VRGSETLTQIIGAGPVALDPSFAPRTTRGRETWPMASAEMVVGSPAPPLITEALVRTLLAAQFPHWAGLPVVRVASGAANALFRLGDELTVRVPLRASAARDAEKEYRYLPRLGPQLPLPIPVPLALGTPSDAYPLSWSVVPWRTRWGAAM